jgi:gamma-glutamylcyclotransferase (GGCT)/AIG2-like uncharacterized protein YtfP
MKPGKTTLLHSSTPSILRIWHHERLLLIQNGYPGVLEEAGLVRVEIFRVGSEGVWETLDRYEGYQPELGYRSLFYRKRVSLLQPRIRAWVYFLGREVPRGRQINPPHVAKDFYFQA